MKKRLFGILSVLAIILGVFALAACGNEPQAVEVKASVKISWEFDASSYNFSYTWYFAETNYGGIGGDGAQTLTTEPTKVTQKTDGTLILSFDGKYDPASVTVAEKDNKPFSKEISKEDAGDSRVIITVPFDENIDYSFSIGTPSGVINRIGFADVDSDFINQTENLALKEVLETAQVWVANAPGGTAGFVNLTKIDPNDSSKRAFNLADKYINIDMSQPTFSVYIRFNATDPLRVVFDDSYRYLFSLTKNGNEYYGSVEEALIPGTNYDALGIWFSIDDYDEYSDTPKFDMGTSLLQEYVSYKAYPINNTVNARPFYYDDAMYQTYKFELTSGTVDGTPLTNFDDLYKNYGKQYILTYTLNEIDASRGGSEEGNAMIEETIAQYTDFTKIKFSVNGETIENTAYAYDSTNEKHTYTIAIGANKIPSDFAHSKNKYFDIGVDVESIQVKSDANYVVHAQSTKEFEIGSINGTVFSQLYYTDKNTETIFFDADTPKEVVATGRVYALKKFKVKVTFNGQAYTSDDITVDVDYLKAMTNKTGSFASFGTADIVEENAFLLTFHMMLGVQSNINNKDQNFLYYYIENDGRLVVTAFDKNSSATNIKFELIDVVHREAQVAFGGEFYAGSHTINGVAQADTLSFGKDNEIVLDLNLHQNQYKIKVDLYSNGTLVYTADDARYLMSGQCPNDAYAYGTASYNNYNTFFGYDSYVLDYAYEDTESLLHLNMTGVLVLIIKEPFSVATEYEWAPIIVDKIVISAVAMN